MCSTGNEEAAREVRNRLEEEEAGTSVCMDWNHGESDEVSESDQDSDTQTRVFKERDPLTTSQLACAVRMGNRTNVIKLLKEGRRVDITDNRGWNAIHEAAAGRDVDCLQLVLMKGQKYVNDQTMQGETPLALACKRRRCCLAVVQLLLDNGANVNLADNEQITPLHIACSKGKHEVASLLITAGTDLNLCNFNEWTPLHCAIKSNNADLVKDLVGYGADCHRRDECGRTPLFLASELGKVDIVKALCDLDPLVDTRADDGATALMLASQNGHYGIVQELLKNGADPNKMANDCTMAIHLSVHNGHLSIVELLLTVTRKDAMLKQKVGLVCLAIDCESLVVLKALLSSDLGEEILHLPIHRAFGPLVPGAIYVEASPISFIFYRECDFPENSILFLDLLLKHNFPVNVTQGNSLPPLDALLSSCLPQPVMDNCLDLLLTHSVDIDRCSWSLGVPNALYITCTKSNIPMMLKLLRIGISGLTEMLIQPFLELYFPEPVENRKLETCRIEMLKLLLKLGASRKIINFLSSWMDRKFSQDTLPSLLEEHYQILTLKQLSRLVVRKYLKTPFKENLSKLPLPVILQEYITYHVL